MKKIIGLLLILATLLSCFAFGSSAANQVVTDEGRLPFEDVKETHWFATQLEFCYANGIIKGMNDYTFGHSGNLTRAQFVTMLASLENVDTNYYTVSKFSDVKSNHWYYGAVAWAYSKGIVSGMTANTFAPNAVLNRAQLATIMRNYMQNKYSVAINNNILNQFPDKPRTDYWYYEAMKYAVSAGLLSGNSDGTLAATGNVTRAQAVVIFKSFMEKYFYASCSHTYTEAYCTASAYCTKCGLKNGLPKGHSLAAYDCVTGGNCSVCSAYVYPSKTLHNFKNATCTSPKSCVRCGVTRGEAKGHNFKAATCTTPKICVTCNATQGYALGHSYSGNYCTRCKDLSPYGKLSYYIKQKGTYDRTENTYTYAKTVGESGAMGVVYDASNGEMGIFYGVKLSSGDYDTTVLMIPKSGTTGRLEYVYYDKSGEIIFHGIGYVDGLVFDGSTYPTFTSYEGGSHNVSQARENAGVELDVMLTYIDNVLVDLGGVYIADFGFEYYK